MSLDSLATEVGCRSQTRPPNPLSAARGALSSLRLSYRLENILQSPWACPPGPGTFHVSSSAPNAYTVAAQKHGFALLLP